MTVVRCLSQYLSSHPMACDTPEGIRRWWLSREAPVPVVQAALVLMQRCGVVQESRAVDGRIRFRRCAADQKEGSANDAEIASRLNALSLHPKTVLRDIDPDLTQGWH